MSIFNDSANPGVIAITSDNNYPNAKAANICATSNGWAGSVIMSPESTAVLLAAKLSNATVTIVISGCTAGGGWYQIAAIYMQ